MHTFAGEIDRTEPKHCVDLPFGRFSLQPFDDLFRGSILPAGKFLPSEAGQRKDVVFFETCLLILLLMFSNLKQMLFSFFFLIYMFTYNYSKIIQLRTFSNNCDSQHIISKYIYVDNNKVGLSR